MSRLSITVSGVTELPGVAKQLLDFAGDARVMLFRGDLGSGKTTLIKALCAALGSTDSFSSPTYGIVNEYESPLGKIFHLDLFRVKHQGELLDIGIDEYLNSGSYCFIEWPELVQDLVEPPYVRVDITVVEGKRIFNFIKR